MHPHKEENHFAFSIGLTRTKRMKGNDKIRLVDRDHPREPTAVTTTLPPAKIAFSSRSPNHLIWSIDHIAIRQPAVTIKTSLIQLQIHLREEALSFFTNTDSFI